MTGLVPSLSSDAWTLIFSFSVASILAWSIPRLMPMLYHLLREFLD